jgi:drug/metabolite transporter superfamily protein YnfA
MIKVLKLQKAVIAIILGIISLVVYLLLREQKEEVSVYFLEASGVFFIAGALMFLYPILLGKKDSDGAVQLNPEIDPNASDPDAQPVEQTRP